MNTEKLSISAIRSLVIDSVEKCKAWSYGDAIRSSTDGIHAVQETFSGKS